MFIRIKGKSYTGRTSAVSRLIRDGDKVLVLSRDGDFMENFHKVNSKSSKKAIITVVSNSSEQITHSTLNSFVNFDDYDVLVIDSFETVMGYKLDNPNIKFFEDMVAKNTKMNIIVVEHQITTLGA